MLIAEQLQAAGARIIIGLTSAGRLAPDLPLPCLVVATSAVRDEGTSYHYLPPSPEVACPTPVVAHLERELVATGWSVRCGKVWTTDAPYRETKTTSEEMGQSPRSRGRDANGIAFCFWRRSAGFCRLCCDGQQRHRPSGRAI